MSRPAPEMTGDGRLLFAVLGSFRVVRDGRQVGLGPRQQRALLAILVVDARHVVPVDRLIGLLWRGEPPAAAIVSVQAYISQLRRVLEPGRPARAPARVLVTQDPGYALRVEDDQVDALRFQALARRAHDDLEAGQPAAAAACLADALALWRGDPLAEFAAEPWAVAAAARLVETYDLATEDRIDAALALGGHAQAAAELEALVAARPLRERRWAQLIVAAYRCGRQADALGAYRRYRAVLADELGLEPGPGLRRLEAAVLAQDPSLDWHPPAAAAVTVPPDAVPEPSETRPTLSRVTREPPPLPGNLPAQVSSFIGRGQELERTAAALERTRVVTLTGVGGVGKTRLAVQAARQARPRFADDTWLAELAPVRDAAGVDDAVAAVFPVTARAGQSTREALVEFLRNKELLLVLDNCEHLLAGAAALAETLARSCEQLVILATSREGLGIDGERLVPVPSLALPGADDSPEAIMQAEAVRLFTDRAAAVKPDFAVTEENAAAVAAVCRRLDGVPLAIELAAARVPALTPAQLARRLDQRFAVLAGGRRGAVERHQTLRAVIDWSFDLLTGPEQALLGRLAVFAGGCTLEAAEKVCGRDGIDPGAVFGLLASLVARSLVVAEEHGPEVRYRLLETIRQYGEQRLGEAGQAERWRARHAGYFADLLGHIRHHNRPDEAFWAARLTAEQDNLLAAWSWAIDTGNVDTAFSILAGFAPSEIWTTYPLKLAGEAAVELPGAAEHPGYPLALAVSALFSSIRADDTGAEELCRQAAEANARVNAPDWRVEETICAARQNIATIRNAFADAALLAEHAAGIARAGGDLADASIELTIAVANHVLAGDPTTGVPLAREALALARQVGAPALIATALLEVGAAVAGTDPGQARACLRESLELSTALGYQKARDLVWAAGIASLLNDRTSTLELARSAIRGLQRSGDRLRIGITLHMIAGTLAATRPEAAAIILGAAEAHVLESARTAPLINSTVAAALGEERARELRARGADMDWDQAVAYTLTQTTRALDEPASEAATTEGTVSATRHTQTVTAAGDVLELSERELEVARLVADGLSNPAIASALFISVATVKTHVSHILAKLGLDSRVQLASWIAGHDPGPHAPARR